VISRIWHYFSDHIDWPLLTAALLLAGAGLTILFSAAGGEGGEKVHAQLRNMGLALAVMWIVANIPPQHLMRLALPLYVAGLTLLIGVALFGEVSHGARRWLHLGFGRIQPSELMKVAIPLTLAWYFHRHEGASRVRDYVLAALLLLIPIGLIVKQPDLGTALLISASGFFVLFFAGLSWKVMIGMGLAGGAAVPVAWSFMHDYQRQRVLTLVDPSSDPLGAGYHIIQSTIAIGSGGVIGKGWLNGTQGHLDFLPERTTDFIFAVFGEEFGLAGNIILLLLYLIIIGRGLYIAANATSLFGRLLAAAVTMTFFTYAFVNMGMVSGILPVVGVPLPLVSYGGTALVTMMVGFGILMSVATHRKLVST
jgi:rod shape determining protein RodA